MQQYGYYHCKWLCRRLWIGQSHYGRHDTPFRCTGRPVYFVTTAAIRKNGLTVPIRERLSLPEKAIVNVEWTDREYSEGTAAAVPFLFRERNFSTWAVETPPAKIDNFNCRFLPPPLKGRQKTLPKASPTGEVPSVSEAEGCPRCTRVFCFWKNHSNRSGSIFFIALTLKRFLPAFGMTSFCAIFRFAQNDFYGLRGIIPFFGFWGKVF